MCTPEGTHKIKRKINSNFEINWTVNLPHESTLVTSNLIEWSCLGVSRTPKLEPCKYSHLPWKKFQEPSSESVIWVTCIQTVNTCTDTQSQLVSTHFTLCKTKAYQLWAHKIKILSFTDLSYFLHLTVVNGRNNPVMDQYPIQREVAILLQCTCLLLQKPG